MSSDWGYQQLAGGDFSVLLKGSTDERPHSDYPQHGKHKGSHLLGCPQISVSAVMDSSRHVDPSPTPSAHQACLRFPTSGLSWKL